MKLKFKSLGVKLWFYITLLAAAIVLLLWLLQIVFFNSFYEAMKWEDIHRIADSIIDIYGQEDFETNIDQLTFENSVLVFLTDEEENIIYASDEHGLEMRMGAPPFNPTNGTVRPLPREFSDFLKRVNESGNDKVSYSLERGDFPGKTLVYGIKTTDFILFISTPLAPVDSTVNILSRQLIYVSVLSVLIGSIIAFFLARKLSKPITKITETAGELAKGDYNVEFEKGDYTEIDNLAGTLNRTAKELSKVEQLRRDLLANISHELRTPLTMIKAYAELIRDISGDKKEKRESHINVIIEESDRLTELVNDVLELSSLQQMSEEAIIPERINLSHTLSAVLSRFCLFAEEEKYIIKTEIEADLYAMAEEKKISQVFYNLIGNAMNYAGEDKQIEVKLKKQNNKIHFQVKDNGEGIPEDELDLIWERYYKSKSQVRTKVSTGLGLAIVKNILVLHNGEYGVISKVGEGSIFWFELDICKN